MEVNALQQMLSRLRQVQEDLQRQVNTVAVEASAGGGMVTVKMNGQKQVLEVRIEPEVFASKDQEMLQDLIRGAVNEASRRVDDELANQMKSLTGSIPGIPGMKIPGLFLISSRLTRSSIPPKRLPNSAQPGMAVPRKSQSVAMERSKAGGLMRTLSSMRSSLRSKFSWLTFFRWPEPTDEFCGVAEAVHSGADRGYTVADFVAGIVGEGVKIDARVLVHAGRGVFIEAVKVDSIDGAGYRCTARLGGNIEISTNRFG